MKTLEKSWTGIDAQDESRMKPWTSRGQELTLRMKQDENTHKSSGQEKSSADLKFYFRVGGGGAFGLTRQIFATLEPGAQHSRFLLR